MACPIELSQCSRACPERQSSPLRRPFLLFTMWMSLLVLLSGCGNTSESVQPEVSAGAILERMTVPPETTQVLEAMVTRPREAPVVPIEEATHPGAVPL